MLISISAVPLKPWKAFFNAEVAPVNMSVHSKLLAKKFVTIVNFRMTSKLRKLSED
jgi:hypothetical protein